MAPPPSPCAPNDICGGVTRDQLLSLWTGAVDPAYSQQMLLLGEGAGSLEHVTQACQVLARTSCAIDLTMQAMYILPWTGQTSPPAQGERLACVRLTFERGLLTHLPMVLQQDVLEAQETQVDDGETGGVDVITGRNYPLKDTLIFNPGENGPFEVAALGERPGVGYNNPMSGTLNSLRQQGVGFNNTGATIVVTAGGTFLQATPDPDVPIPDHVGQYVQFLSGANAGRILRVAGYQAPDTTSSPPTGGTFVLEPTLVLEAVATGNYVQGEIVNQAATGAVGHLLKVSDVTSPYQKVSIVPKLGTFALGPGAAFNIVGVQSGVVISTDTAANPLTAVLIDPLVIPEVGTAVWQVIPWAAFGLTVTNVEQPTGGRAAILDTLGFERKIPRAPGESDDSYRKRIATIADVVSPNALQRTANRILAPLGAMGCLREVGQLKLTGFYYDAGKPYRYSYDLDAITLNAISIGPSNFKEDEKVILFDSTGTVTLGTGYFGGFTAGGKLVIILKTNKWQDAIGGLVKGTVSGAIYQVLGITVAGIAATDRFKLIMSYEEFRAFFLMGVPPLSLGEFGFAWDVGPFGAYDSAPALTFFDGFPVTAAIIYRSIWQALDKVKAGGVGFDLYLEDIGCI